MKSVFAQLLEDTFPQKVLDQINSKIKGKLKFESEGECLKWYYKEAPSEHCVENVMGAFHEAIDVIRATVSEIIIHDSFCYNESAGFEVLVWINLKGVIK